MCRAHGIPGEFHESAWLNHHPVPRFYPNIVTLTNQSAAQLALIHHLASAGPAGSWAIKDSFGDLDLPAPGFQLLFEATWLWRAPSAPLPSFERPGTTWARLSDPAQLATWETAWGGNPTDDVSTPQPRLFLPSLLSDPDNAFIAAFENGEIVAGAIANRSDAVVGLSNIFTPPGDGVPFWAGCVATATEAFPGLPLVGYESGPDLARAEQVGFERLHPLKVWLANV